MVGNCPVGTVHGIHNNYKIITMSPTKEHKSMIIRVFLTAGHELSVVRRNSNMSFDSDHFKQPLIALSELCEIKVAGSNPRPICNLVS